MGISGNIRIELNMKGDWWKGLSKYNGQRVLCKDNAGVLTVNHEKCMVETEVDGKKETLPLSGFEIASGHGGKNARKSIRLEVAGVLLGDAAGQEGGAKDTSNKSSAPWWKGLIKHNGERVLCKDNAGFLIVTHDKAMIETMVDGKKETLTLSGFEVASGHGGKNAKKSIRLEASGIHLGDAAGVTE